MAKLEETAKPLKPKRCANTNKRRLLETVLANRNYLFCIAYVCAVQHQSAHCVL